MVLRPTVLRYKGKVRKIDGEKMQKINQHKQGLKQVENMQILSKANFGVGFAMIFVFMVPIMYMGYNNFKS